MNSKPKDTNTKMGKLSEFLTEGSVTLNKAKSPINGQLTVKWDTFAGYQILGGGLWQVGGPVETVWRLALKKAHVEAEKPNILILGLGGGTIAKLARSRYRQAKIVGVDVDPVIVKLGQEYLGLNKTGTEIIIGDAYKFLINEERKEKYHLICVDMYVGDTYPEKFETQKFIDLLKEKLRKDGLIIVNRLYYGQKTKKAETFLKLLKENFKNVAEYYPRIAENVLYIANN